MQILVRRYNTLISMIEREATTKKIKQATFSRKNDKVNPIKFHYTLCDDGTGSNVSSVEYLCYWKLSSTNKHDTSLQSAQEVFKINISALQ